MTEIASQEHTGSSPPRVAGTEPADRRGIFLLLLVFLALAFAYSLVNPLHEATDELRHYRFVRIIATSSRLPVQGQGACRAQGHHPPLFYAAGALLTAWIDTGRDICHEPPKNPFWAYRYWEVGRDNKNQYLHDSSEAFPWYGEALAVHIVRGLNVIIGAGVVLLTWATARLIWPGRSRLPLGAAALVAFNPMFLYMSGAINNDVIAAFSGAAVIYACGRLIDSRDGLSWRWGLVLGGLYGLALMSKFNLAAIIVVIEAAVTWVAWRRGQWRRWLVVNGLIVAGSALVAGWWFARNQALYGEPTGFQAVTELWGVRDPFQSFGLAVSELPYAWSTLWGRFGFGQIPLPQVLYDLLLVVCSLGLLGAVIGLLGRPSARGRILLLLAGLNMLLFFAVLFNYMLVSPAGPNGRFLFPALSSLAVLIFYGLSHFPALGRLPDATRRTAQRLVTLVVSAGMFTLALVALFGYLVPAYARPPALEAEALVPNRLDIRFDSLATLLGYEISGKTVQAGEPLDVTLYWEVNARPPGNYLLFLHLIDQAGVMVAQRDTHPGLGNFPTGQWSPGDRFIESIRLYLPETAYAPETADIYVGLYDPTGYRLAVSSASGEPLGDSAHLGQVAVAPNAGAYPNSQDQTFTSGLRLVGYEYGRRQVPAGGSLTVNLFWEALPGLNRETNIRLRLLDLEGQPRASSESRPSADWLGQPHARDSHMLDVPGDLPPGRYDLELAVINAQSGLPEFLVADDGHYIDSRLLLAQVRVMSQAPGE